MIRTQPPDRQRLQWTGTAQSITQIFVTFSKPLIASTAINPANYALVNVGPNGKYGTIDDSSVAMSVAMSQSSSLIVALTPARPLPANRFSTLDQRRHPGRGRGPGS